MQPGKVSVTPLSVQKYMSSGGCGKIDILLTTVLFSDISSAFFPYCFAKRLPGAAPAENNQKRLYWHLFKQNGSALVNFIPPGERTVINVSFVLEKLIEMVRSVVIRILQQLAYCFFLLYFTNV